MAQKLTIIVQLLLLLQGCAQQAPDETQIGKYSIEDFYSSSTYRGLYFSPDNKKLLTTSDRTGVENAWVLLVEGSGPYQLTHSSVESISTSGYFPADERSIYSSDLGGNENNHVFVLNVDGSVVDLTPGEAVKAAFKGWAADGNSFFIMSNERDPAAFDIYEYDATTYGRKLFYQNDAAYRIGALGPNGRYVMLERIIDNRNIDVYLYDRMQGTTLLTDGTGNITSWAQTFNPEGTAAFVTTDEDHEFQYLIRIDLADRSRKVVIKPDWDVSRAWFSGGGRYLLATINIDARQQLALFDAQTLKRVPIPSLPNGVVSGAEISGDGNLLAVLLTDGRGPPDVYLMDLKNGGASQLTQSLNPEIRRDDLVAGEVVRFTSYDGVRVPGILYKPHGASSANKVPAVIWVHGGPGGETPVRYDPLFQYLVNSGYAVYAINHRGSDGSGKTYAHLDDRKHGDADLDDCVAAVKMLAELGYIAPDKIGIGGSSYGGYMTLAGLAFRPKVFAFGIDFYGPANWVRTMANFPPWYKWMWNYMGSEFGDLADTEYFESISPLFAADRIVKPLFVAQGANDPRVLKTESDEIVAALRARNIPVEYVIFGDEGHGFRKSENKIRAYREIVKFLNSQLGYSGAR